MPTLNRSFYNLTNGDTFTVSIPSGVEIVSATARYKGGNKTGIDSQNLENEESDRNVNVEGIPSNYLSLPAGESFYKLVVSGSFAAIDPFDGSSGAEWSGVGTSGTYYSSSYMNDMFQSSGEQEGDTLYNTLSRNGYTIDSDSHTHDSITGESSWRADITFSLYWILELENPYLQVDGAVSAQHNGVINHNNYQVVTIDKDELQTGDNNLSFHAVEGMGDVTIEIDYTHAPTTPQLVDPNGGETWNALHTININPSTDADGDTLTYEFELSTDDGVTYYPIGSTQSSSYAYDFTNEEATSTARLRVRATDGYTYSDWDISDGVFTIQHNVSPETPTGLQPSGGEPIDRAKETQFSWTHQDPNSNDPQSKVDVQWRAEGANNWNTETVVTPNGSITFDSNTFPYGRIEWRVRTYDQDGLVGPYSSIAVLFAGNKPVTPSIIEPSIEVAVANPTVQWSSSDQVTYTLRVLENTTEIYEHAGDTNKAHTIQLDLENGKSYTFELTITNDDGLESDAAVLNVNVSYTPPAVPDVALIIDNASAKAVVTIEHPTPEGTQPTVEKMDIYRREINKEWLRLFTDLPASEDYLDHTLASGVEYEFYVRVWGNNGTYSDSLVVRGQMKLSSIWLHDPDDENSLHQFKYYEPQRQSSKTIGGSTKHFEGRPFPVADFNNRINQNVSPVLQLMGNDLHTLHDLVNRQKTLLYRDNRGRRIFCVIFGVPETDEFWGTTAQIEIIAVDYKEGM